MPQTTSESIDLDATAIPGRESFPPAASDEGSRGPAPFGVPLGARLINDGRCEFRVWAPTRERVEVHIVSPNDRRVALKKMPDGYHEATVDDVREGARYFFVLDGGSERPDPASRHQPDGVHAASAVVGRDFEWTDEEWRGIPLEDYVIYELHVGTFTPEGTYEAIIPQLDRLKELGITVVELLPVAQFPGERNWGYDGVFVGAAQSSYGGPRALKRLVDACHARGMAIVLDVVYNHLGPEGNYLGEYGPYFTDRYKTPWGLALNFDGPQSDHVRWYFVHNALQWVDEFHFDGLRVDAVHAIIDHSAEPFLQDLCTAVRKRGEMLQRKIYTIAESDLNDPRVITIPEQLGIGFDSQWNDDFHHSLHVQLTGEQAGYYVGFQKTSDLARVFRDGYLYTGQHSVFRARKYGTKANTTNGAQFVVFAQNHDQVGNRMMGDRLTNIVGHDQLRLAAAVVVLSPFLPMLFMGEEYGEKAPFQYFTSHSDEALIEAVRNGRAEEFRDFAWQGEAPDPHATETYERSKLNWELLEKDEHQSLFRLYKQLFALRRDTPALRTLDLSQVETWADDELRVMLVQRGGTVLVGFNFGDKAQSIDVPWKTGTNALIETGAKIEGGKITIPPHSFAVFG